MFKISNETYPCFGKENPDKYGYIEGYTSNTPDEYYLRLNCKVLIDEDKIDWYKRVYGAVPTTPVDGSYYLNKLGCRELKPGDRIGEGLRLNQDQVRHLIYELEKWLSDAPKSEKIF